MTTTIPQIDALLTVRSEDEHMEFEEAADPEQTSLRYRHYIPFWA